MMMMILFKAVKRKDLENFRQSFHSIVQQALLFIYYVVPETKGSTPEDFLSYADPNATTNTMVEAPLLGTSTSSTTNNSTDNGNLINPYGVGGVGEMVDSNFRRRGGSKERSSTLKMTKSINSGSGGGFV
jgi:hypothetical protein